jgi:hypothetical protein
LSRIKAAEVAAVVSKVSGFPYHRLVSAPGMNSNAGMSPGRTTARGVACLLMHELLAMNWPDVSRAMGYASNGSGGNAAKRAGSKIEAGDGYAVDLLERSIAELGGVASESDRESLRRRFGLAA